MPGNPSAKVLLAIEVGKYRECMAKHLQASLIEMNEVISTVDFDECFRPMNQQKFDEDPLIAFRKMSYLLIAKARLHVCAALRANKSGNIHSLAVQMRPALECAGQVVSIFKNLFDKGPSAERRIGQYINSDYYQMVIRLSKGQTKYTEILEMINEADPAGNNPVRKIRKFRESEKVKDLEFGDHWYRHLSSCFFHSDLSALKGLSYFGGVSSCNTMYDEYAFAVLMDYLAHQAMTMLMYESLCPDGNHQDDNRFDKSVELLGKKKAETGYFRDTLMSKTGKRDTSVPNSESIQ